MTKSNSAKSKRKIVVIPDSFKGSMASDVVTDIIAKAADKSGDYEIVKIPIADGGEGSTKCILGSLGGKIKSVKVHSPEKSPIKASYGVTPDNTAVIEIAESSGITRQTSFNAKEATSYGFGEIIRDALDEGVRKFLLCLGGSATTDCGAGMAAALGVKFMDSFGKEFVPTGASLSKVMSIDLSGLDSRISKSNFIVMSDVENPLYGPNGAAYVYAPQKGASKEDVVLLDEGLKHISEVMVESGLIDCREVYGAGAAGGAGYGCRAFLGAEVVSGINAILDIWDFDNLARTASLIVTGEGKFDSQSLMGKAISGIRKHSGRTPMVVFCGICEVAPDVLEDMHIEVVEIGRGMPLEESMQHGAKNLEIKAKGYFDQFSQP